MSIVKRLRRFVQQVTDRADLNEKETDLAQDLVRGISQTGSVRLSDTARILDKGLDVPLIRTEQRLSKGLAAEGSGLDRIQDAYLRSVSPVTRTLPFLIVDGSQNTHLYGKAYEFLDRVQDRSLPNKPIVPGYWTVHLEACDAQHRHLPLYQDVYSTQDPAYQALGQGAWQTQFWKGIEAVLPYLTSDIIALFDRGFDDHTHLQHCQEHLPRHIVRMGRKRNVEVGDPRNPEVWNIGLLADHLQTPHDVEVEYVDKSTHRLKSYRLRFTWIPVRIPGLTWTYYLLVVRGTRGEDWLLLSSFRPHNVAEARQIIQAFVRRWGGEETIRFGKQCTGAEKIMVRSLRAIRRLLWLAMIATGAQAMWMFRNRRLVQRLIDSVKVFIRDVPFLHYRLWQSVKDALVQSG